MTTRKEKSSVRNRNANRSLRIEPLEGRLPPSSLLWTGTPWDDEKTGTPEDDVLIGCAGNDQLFGGDGDDFLSGGAGNDSLDGGSDNDVLDGGNGDDNLLGGSGYDALRGGNGKDVLDGGSGSDLLYGGQEADTLIWGLSENYRATDIYHGGAGSDKLVIKLTKAECDTYRKELRAFKAAIESGQPLAILQLEDNTVLKAVSIESVEIERVEFDYPLAAAATSAALATVNTSDILLAEITVSPNVINIGSQAEVVTVHTDLPYSTVRGASVSLNGIEIESWKADDRGYFVAKFEASDVKGIVKPGTATLTLTGQTTDGQFFSGTDTVQVINPKTR